MSEELRGLVPLTERRPCGGVILKRVHGTCERTCFWHGDCDACPIQEAFDRLALYEARVPALLEELDETNIMRETAEEQLLDALTDTARLTARVAELEARCSAAEGDLKVGWTCRACKKRVVGHEWCECPDRLFVAGPENAAQCANFEWRGPQAGEGAGE